jgi:pyruvate/2-oxoglutarate dehydrogenase complex dihydrolipoamide acyltransferase (E2) component
MLPLSLSYDHRVIDGALGARFITHLSGLLPTCVACCSSPARD